MSFSTNQMFKYLHIMCLQDNPRLYLQLIDMGLQQNPLNEDNIISIIDQFLSRDTDPEQKVLFAQRKVEFLEDFGNDILRYVVVFLLLSTLLVNLYPTARHIWCRLGSARRTNAPYVLRCGHLNRCTCVAINVYKS